MRISDWSSDVCSSDLREAAHEVRNRVDRAERHDVVDAREVADTDGADGQPLHRAGDAARGDHVALVERVLELDEDAGDDVLHQLLRTEADREPDHRSEEHTSELQSPMRSSSAVLCLHKKTEHTDETDKPH